MGIDIPAFIRKIREGDYSKALEKIAEENPFPGICGRICPAPCEKKCILTKENNPPIQIRELERFASQVGNFKLNFSRFKKDKKSKVALIGSGPAALMAAARLMKNGYSIGMWEAFPQVGGTLKYGVSSLRLPQGILEKETTWLKKACEDLHQDTYVGASLSLEEIFQKGYQAILLVTGAGVLKFEGISQDNLNNLFSTQEFLMHVQLRQQKSLKKNFPFQLGSPVVVVGSSSEAFDCARLCVRQNSQVTLISESTEAMISVSAAVIEQAEEEGVTVEILTKAQKILTTEDQDVCGLQCLKMDFADPNEDGQWKIIPVAGSEFDIPAETIICDVPRKANHYLKRYYPRLKLNKDESIWINRETFQTSMEDIYAAGALTQGPISLIEALASGKKAAQAIKEQRD